MPLLRGRALAAGRVTMMQKPSDLEAMRAVRYMRHRETCPKCTSYGNNPCVTALRQYGLWAETWDREVWEPAEERRTVRRLKR